MTETRGPWERQSTAEHAEAWGGSARRPFWCLQLLDAVSRREEGGGWCGLGLEVETRGWTDGRFECGPTREDARFGGASSSKWSSGRTRAAESGRNPVRRAQRGCTSRHTRIDPLDGCPNAGRLFRFRGRREMAHDGGRDIRKERAGIECAGIECTRDTRERWERIERVKAQGRELSRKRQRLASRGPRRGHPSESRSRNKHCAWRCVVPHMACGETVLGFPGVRVLAIWGAIWGLGPAG